MNVVRRATSSLTLIHFLHFNLGEQNIMAAFTTGSNGVRDNSGKNIWYRIPQGTSKLIPLQSIEDKVVNYAKHDTWGAGKQVHHVCIGEEDGCPGCAAGIPTSNKHSLVVMTDDDPTPRIFEFGVTIHKQLLAAERAEPENFIGRVFVVERTGKGKSTRYTINGTMKVLSSLPDPATYPDITKILVTDKAKLDMLYSTDIDDALDD
jgi:hypothetical protein